MNNNMVRKQSHKTLLAHCLIIRHPWLSLFSIWRAYLKKLLKRLISALQFAIDDIFIGITFSYPQQLMEPHDITVHSGEIYVADVGANRVWKFWDEATPSNDVLDNGGWWRG